MDECDMKNLRINIHLQMIDRASTSSNECTSEVSRYW
ncbi:MAG: hypothetical protein ACI8RD_007827 [Bacillariaceae sp.]|jgi:hypothetical protein